MNYDSDISRRGFLGGTAAFAGTSLFGAAPASGRDSPWETPSGDATPAVMVRRLWLDLAGRIPTPNEARSFVSEEEDPQARFRELVEQLLAADSFADYWSMRFCDILRVKSEFPINLWPNAVYVYHRRIRNFVLRDEPWSDFARSLLSATGSDFRDAEVNFFRAVSLRTPEGFAAAAAATFLDEDYASLPPSVQKDYARFFRRVRIKTTREWKEEVVELDPSDPSAPTPSRFADMLLGPARKRFAAAFVRRVDWWLLGLESPDPAHVECFVRNGFRLKPLVREIVLSPAYSRGSVTGGFPCRRLDAEVLEDMICDITGAKRDHQSIAPEPFTFLPPSRRSILIEDGSITSAFLLLFGRPARDTGLLSERSSDIDSKQRLYLFNSGFLYERLSRLVGENKFRDMPLPRFVRSLYWRFLSRPPSSAELNAILAENKRRPTAQERAAFRKDVAWALLNTREFIYRH